MAKAKGVRFGCQKKEIPHNFRKYFEMWEQGEISSRKAASALNMSHTTFYRRCREQILEREETKNCYTTMAK